MMIPERPALERRVLAALDGSASGQTRIPVILGGCGSGRTSLLLRLRDLIGRGACQYVDVGAIATTPERFSSAIVHGSPFTAPAPPRLPATESGARDAFEATLLFLDGARTAEGGAATFLLD